MIAHQENIDSMLNSFATPTKHPLELPFGNERHAFQSLKALLFPIMLDLEMVEVDANLFCVQSLRR